MQAAIAHTNLPEKLSKDDVSRLSALTSHLEGLKLEDPESADLKVATLQHIHMDTLPPSPPP